MDRRTPWSAADMPPRARTSQVLQASFADDATSSSLLLQPFKPLPALTAGGSATPPEAVPPTAGGRAIPPAPVPLTASPRSRAEVTRPPHPAVACRQRNATRTSDAVQQLEVGGSAAERRMSGRAVHIPASLVQRAPRDSGAPLSEPIRRAMEAALDTDLSSVRIHTSPAARQLGTLAFSMGDDIYFAPGQYRPDTGDGQQLLGRELSHVMQQRAGRVINPFPRGAALVLEPELEAEATRLGSRLAEVLRAGVSHPAASRAEGGRSGSSRGVQPLRGRVAGGAASIAQCREASRQTSSREGAPAVKQANQAAVRPPHPATAGRHPATTTGHPTTAMRRSGGTIDPGRPPHPAAAVQRKAAGSRPPHPAAAVQRKAGESTQGVAGRGACPLPHAAIVQRMEQKSVRINKSDYQAMVGGQPAWKLLDKPNVKKALLARFTGSSDIKPVDIVLQFDRDRTNPSALERQLFYAGPEAILGHLEAICGQLELGVPESKQQVKGPRATVTLAFDWLYAGNQENSMQQKSAGKSIDSSMFLQEPAPYLEHYVRSIRQSSITPVFSGFDLFEGHSPLGKASPQMQSLFVALKQLIDGGKTNLIVRPRPVRFEELVARFTQRVSAARRVPPGNYMEPGELETLFEMHAQGLHDERDDTVLRNLYQEDSIALAIVTDDLEGDPVSWEELMEINRVIQTSGTNRELDGSSAEKAGKIRDRDVTLPGGLKLVPQAQVEAALGEFLHDYNRFIVEVAKTPPGNSTKLMRIFYGTAVQLHQRFIRIHPFSNGNGRVARVLFYNLFVAADLPLFRINPDSDTFKAMSGMELKGERTLEDLTKYLMELHLQSLGGWE